MHSPDPAVAQGDHDDPTAQLPRPADGMPGRAGWFHSIRQWMRNLIRNDETDSPDLQESSDEMPDLADSSPPSSDEMPDLAESVSSEDLPLAQLDQ